MLHKHGITAIILTLVSVIGCSPSSQTSSASALQPQAVNREKDEVADLLIQYEMLPKEQRQSLVGDKLIMRVEALLKSKSGPAPSWAEAVVREHNREMVQRALQDPDLLEVIGTETAPPPRER
jgi:hypothetical protein